MIAAQTSTPRIDRHVTAIVYHSGRNKKKENMRQSFRFKPVLSFLMNLYTIQDLTSV